MGRPCGGEAEAKALTVDWERKGFDRSLVSDYCKQISLGYPYIAVSV